MDNIETTDEYTTKDMFTDIAKDTTKIVAAHAIAAGILLGIGYTYGKILERRAKKAAEQTN